MRTNVSCMLVIFLCFATLVFAAGKSEEVSVGADEYYEIKLYPENYDPKFEQYADKNTFRMALKEKFNFGFELIANPGDPKEILTVWLASGDYPELVRLYDKKYEKAYYEADALINFKPLAQEHGQDFIDRKGWECDAITETIKSWGATSDEWYFYNFARSSAYGYARPYLEWLFRSDILEQQGYPEIADEYDVLEILKQGLNDNPKTDGKPTIGFSLPFAAWNGTGTKVATYLANVGDMHHFTYEQHFVYDPDIEEYMDFYASPSLVAALKFYHMAYNEGVLDKECFTDDWDAYQKKMETGQVLGNFFMMWDYPNYNNKLQAADKSYRYVPMTSMLRNQIAAGEKKMYAERTTTVEPGWNTMAITKNCKYPERLMEVLNWCMSDEGMVLSGWGDEGVNYVIDDSGKRIVTEEFYQRVQDDPDFRYTFAWEPMFGFDDTYDESGQCYNIMFDPQVTARAQDPKIQEVYSNYGWSTFNDLYTKNENFESEIALTFVKLPNGSDLWSEDEKKTWEKIVKVTRDAIVKIIISDNEDEFNKLYNEMMEKRESYGLSKFLSRLNETYGKYYQEHKAEGNY